MRDYENYDRATLTEELNAAEQKLRNLELEFDHCSRQLTNLNCSGNAYAQTGSLEGSLLFQINNLTRQLNYYAREIERERTNVEALKRRLYDC